MILLKESAMTYHTQTANLRRWMDKYLDWSKGFVDSFHRYYVYNAKKQVTKNRFSSETAKENL